MVDRRDVLLVIRKDLGAAFRDAVSLAWGIDATDYLKPTKWRRTTDASGTWSHWATHGRIPSNAWATLVGILTDVSDGVRDSTDWRGKPGTPVAQATWAVAKQSGDVVVAFLMTELDGAPQTHTPQAGLTLLGLVKQESV